MSSFINSAKHFNSIEGKLISLTYSKEFSFPYRLSAFPALSAGYFHSSQNAKEQEIKEAMTTLRELQVTCVFLQYKKDYAGTLDRQIAGNITALKDFDKSYTSLTLTGLLKALQCLRYQIEPEHLKELRGLTTEENNALHFLDILIPHLALTLISQTPDYDAAKWAID